MREKLLKILNVPIYPHELVDPLEAVTDYLLDNDVVPVVRCKDCKHNVANSETDPLDSTDYTDIVCRYWMSDGCEPEDFCSHGERRCESPES